MRFVKTYRLPSPSHSTSDSNDIIKKKGINIAFWTISKDEVPSTINLDDSYFKQRGLDLLENEFYETGNFNLSYLPHQQTQLIYNTEIKYNPNFLKEVSANARLESSLHIAKMANIHFNRSEAVDEAVLRNFVHIVLPNAAPLKLAESDKIERCKTLLKWGDKKTKWKRMPGTLNDVVEKFQSVDISEKLITIKGITKIHVSCEVVLAYFMHTNSNERIEEHLEVNGNTERTWRCDYKTHTAYISAEIPLPLIASRRFKATLTWKKGWGDNPNAYVIAILPDTLSDDSPSKAVQGSSTALVVLEPLDINVTKIMQIQQTDLALGSGIIGTAVSNYTAKYLLSSLDILYTKYQRVGTMVDSEIRKTFEENISKAPKISDELEDLIKECTDLADVYDSNDMMVGTGLKKPSPSGEMSMKRKKKRGLCERSIAVGRCSDIVDSSPTAVLAWLYDVCSSERMRIHREYRNIARLVSANDGRQQLVAVIKRLQWPLSNREFVTQMVWWQDNNTGTYYLAFSSIGEDIDYGSPLSMVRGFTRALMKLEPFGEVVEGKRTQCRMSFTQIFDASGYIPGFIVNSLLPVSLSLVEEVRSVFSRDDEIDSEDRKSLIHIMENSGGEKYDQHELASIKSIQALAADVVAGGNLKPLDSPSQYVIMKSGVSDGDPNLVGFGEVVLDGSLESCALVEYMAYSRWRHSDYFQNDGGIQKNTHHNNSHSFVNRIILDLKVPGFAHREFVWNILWKKTGNQIDVVYISLDDLDSTWNFPAASPR